MTNEQIIWNYFLEKLSNPYGVAALMGNLYAESSLNPINSTGAKKYGLSNEEYTMIADEGKNDNFATDSVAYGLAQWRYHTRKRGLLNFARTEQKSVGDLNLQLKYIWYELGSYKTVMNALTTAKDIKSASDVFLLKYEKPANTTEAVKEKRAKYGQKYYDKYANNENIHLEVNKNEMQEIYDQLKWRV